MLFSSGENNILLNHAIYYVVRSRNNLTENIEIPQENTGVFHALKRVTFFYIFTSENMENTSALVCRKTTVTI